jgi:hypothetical protein
MSESTATITVKKSLKSSLLDAKGKKDWSEFLEELLAEWNKTKGTAKFSGGGIMLGPALGPALDVMKPWSMKITPRGINVEEIPRTEGQGTRPEKPIPEAKTPDYPSPSGGENGRSVYQSWSIEVRSDSTETPREQKPAETEPAVKGARASSRKGKRKPAKQARSA